MSEQQEPKSDLERGDVKGSQVPETPQPTGASAGHSVAQPSQNRIPAAFYVGLWIFFSGSVILSNKWVLHSAAYPITLTTWHLIFSTIATQILARTTHLLDGIHNVRMTGKVYLRAIVPIGMFFSLSLICSNVAYLYLSVAFIQMLKATTPVAVLVTTWMMGLDKFNPRTLLNVSVIVIGVIIASYGELQFVLVGFVFQTAGILFEATRLVMVQRLLSSAEYKMDPLVSLYYFAPVCALMNGICCLVFEGPKLSIQVFTNLGFLTLFLNAAIAFCLNVSVVFLIGKTSSLVLTLSGVLKDILLVMASVAIWRTPVSLLQILGYSISLIGLIYYKLGADQMKQLLNQVTGSDKVPYVSHLSPLRRALILSAVALVLLIFFGVSFNHILPTQRVPETTVS